MKYIYLIPIFLFSCNNQKEKGKHLIELNEKEIIIQQQVKTIDSLKSELDNCKLNYDALDKATN